MPYVRWSPHARTAIVLAASAIQTRRIATTWEGVDIGTDNETPVTEEYREGKNRFAGKIHKVVVALKPGEP